MSEWLTPHGTPATAVYYRAVQAAVIAWWRTHRRRDLPWRQHAEQRAAAEQQQQQRHCARKRTRPHSSCCTDDVPPPPPHCYDAYEVWVAEVMSQQTRLDTVVVYFAAWLRRFATVAALARAREDEVRAAWAGLGYYRRAMYLHKGAQELARRAAAAKTTTTRAAVTLPRTAAELRTVPGIGPYTAAAIASVCYGERVMAVDGNVVRVLARLRGERGFDPKTSANLRRAEVWGQQLMHGGDNNNKEEEEGDDGCKEEQDEAMPGALNQGLMELGASVCRPTAAPLCVQCPLRALCVSYAQLQSGVLPRIEGVVPLRAAPPHKRNEHVVCVVHELPPRASNTRKRPRQCNNSNNSSSSCRCSNNDATACVQRRFVLLRRPSSGLLGGMLEFPLLTLPTSTGDGDDIAATTAATREQRMRAVQLLSCGARVLCDKDNDSNDSSSSSDDAVAADDKSTRQATSKRAARTTTTTSRVPVLRACGTVRHIFSHIDMTIAVYHVRWCATAQTSSSSSSRVAGDALERRVCARVARALHAGATTMTATTTTTAVTRPRCDSTKDGNSDDGDGGDAVCAIARRVRVVDECALASSAAPRLLHKILQQVDTTQQRDATLSSSHDGV